MYQFKKDGISVKPVLDKRIVNSRRCYAVRICVIYRRQSKYYSVGEFLSVTDWNRLFKSTRKDLVSIRERVDNRFDLIVDIVVDLMERQLFSFDNLKAELLKQTSPSYNVDHLKE